MAGNEALFQKAMNQGHSAAWDGSWDQASFFYQQALEQFPDNPKALTSLGLALFELQQYEDAVNSYRRAAVITPDDPLPIEKVAQISERLGRLDDATRAGLQAADLYIKNHEIEKAIENWIRVTQIKPENLAAHSRLAMIYERLGRTADAVGEYLFVASLVQHAGDHVKASQAVNYAFKIMPENPEARQALSLIKSNQILTKPARPRGGTGPVLMAKVRDFETAGTDQEKTYEPDPITEARQKALITLAGVFFDQTSGAIDEQGNRRELISITHNPVATDTEENGTGKMALHLTQAIDAQTQERNEVAANEMQKAITDGLSQPAGYFDLGLLLFQSGKYEPAIASLRVAVRAPDFTLASRLIMGQSLRKLGRLNEAVFEYLEALKVADVATVSPQGANEMVQLYESLIDTQSQKIDQVTGENLCNNIAAILEKPDWKNQLLLARKQIPEQAENSTPLPLAEIMLQAHSGQVVESLKAIHAMEEKGQYRTATEEAFFTLMFAPGYLPLHIEIGELLLKENHTQEAIQKLLIVAQVYSVRGETDQAIGLLRRIIQLNPMDLTIRNRLIEALIGQGNVDEGIREYLDLADTYYRLTEFDSARKTYMLALRQAQQSNASRKWSTKILMRIADIDMQRMDWRQALRVFEQIRILQPDDEKARLNLIDINYRIGQENSGLIELDSYIRFLEDKGQAEKAVQFLTELIVDRPTKIDLHRRLAELYQKTAQTEKAIEVMDTMGELLVERGKQNRGDQYHSGHPKSQSTER